MRLHNRTSTVSVGPPPEPPKSRAAKLTQFVYIAVLVGFVAYLLYLGWRYAFRLELDGQVMVGTRVLSAPQAGQVAPQVERDQVVEPGDTLALIDPQRVCEERVQEDRRLVQTRHELRLAQAEEALVEQRLQRLREDSPASTVQRALELDGSRGDRLVEWRERLEAVRDERELTRIETASLQAQLTEIEARAAMTSRLDPACLTQSLEAPIAGTVVAVQRAASEFIQRGEPLFLLRAERPQVWIEVFAESDELSALAGQSTARVEWPDGKEDEGRVKRVESAATDVPQLETRDYVPVGASLRVILEPRGEAAAARWRAYSRMSVKVVMKR